MKQVKKDELSGFRIPEAREREVMQKKIIPQLKLERRVMKYWFWICVFFDVCFLIRLVTGYHELLTGELAVGGVFAVGLAVAVILLCRGFSRNRLLMKLIADGSFEVLDCKAYQTGPSTDTVGYGTVRICTEQGQYCEDNFIVDLLSMQEWSNRRDMNFWLLKCSYGDSGDNAYYELFSEKTLI